MIVKKVGYLLLIRLKLFKVMAKLSPLAILASFFLVFYMLHLKEEYTFQEPSLATRLDEVFPHKSSLKLNYIELRPGVKYIKIIGGMENQCLLLTFPQENENSDEIKNIFQTLSMRPYNPKSIVLLSYSTVQALKEFFQWYFNPKENVKFSFGIIRVGLNIDFSIQNKTKLAGNDRKQLKNRAIFNIYSPILYPDLDYHRAIKQLLYLTLFSYVPCEEIQKEPLRSIKQGFLSIGKIFDFKHEIKGFADHFLCEFNTHIRNTLSAHEVMMRNGFQAATVKFIIANRTQKAEEIVVSFLNEFSLQEEHLHSAATYYYPISRTLQLPIMGYMSTSLLFSIGVVTYLINKFLGNYEKMNLNLPLPILVVSWIWVWEYGLMSSTFFTLLIAITLAFLSIGTDMHKVLILKVKSIPSNYAEFIILGFSALISVYFGLLCYSLSIIAMMTATILLLKPQRTILRAAYKIIVFCLFGVALTFTDNGYNSSVFVALWESLEQLSDRLRTILIVMFLHLAL